MYSAENALNTTVFPSLERMQRDILRSPPGFSEPIAFPWSSRGGVRGYLTWVAPSHCCRQRRPPGTGEGRARRGRPEHGARHLGPRGVRKAAHYFDIESRRIPVRPEFSADVHAMADAVDDSTVMIVGSPLPIPRGSSTRSPTWRPSPSNAAPVPCRCLYGRLHLPVPRPARARNQTVGSLRARGDLDLGRPPQVRVRIQGSLGDPLQPARAGRPPAVRDLELAGGLYGSPSMAGTRPAGPIGPAGPCSTTWVPTDTCGWPKTPTRQHRRCKRPSRVSGAGRPWSPGRHRVRLRSGCR